MGWPKYREYRSEKVLGWGLPGTVPDGMAKVQGIQIQKGIGVGLTNTTVPDGMAKVQGIQIQVSIGAGLTRDSPSYDVNGGNR